MDSEAVKEQKPERERERERAFNAKGIYWLTDRASVTGRWRVSVNPVRVYVQTHAENRFVCSRPELNEDADVFTKVYKAGQKPPRWDSSV